MRYIHVLGAYRVALAWDTAVFNMHKLLSRASCCIAHVHVYGFEAAHPSSSWGHSRSCQWTVSCSIPNPVMPRKKAFQLESNRFRSPPARKSQTDNYNLSIMIPLCPR